MSEGILTYTVGIGWISVCCFGCGLYSTSEINGRLKYHFLDLDLD
jgi:hypothetical protein